MKKILLFIFSFFLGLTFISAKVNLSDQVIDPLVLKPGDRIAIRFTMMDDSEESKTYSYLGSTDRNLSWVKLPENVLTPATSFVLESADGMLKGYPYYYLKNEVTGLYLDYEFIDGEGGSISGSFPNDLAIECRLIYTSNKKEASAFAIAPSQKAIHWGVYAYPNNWQLPKSDKQNILTRCNEYLESPAYLSLNQAFVEPYAAHYTDWASWFEVFKLSTETDYVEDLKTLLEQASEQNFVAGYNWGDYTPDLVAEFENCKDEASVLAGDENADPLECERVYHALKSAWDNLVASGPKQLTPGYYRIVSSYPKFQETQDVEKAMYATNEGEVKWKTYDREDPTMGWELLKNEDGSWSLKNLGTQQYVSGSDGTSASGSLKYVTSFDGEGHSIELQLLENKDFNIFYKDMKAMNMAGHSSGGGIEGYIVGWTEGTLSPASWYLRPLGTDTAVSFSQYGIFAKKRLELTNLIDSAQEKYNKGWNAVIDAKPEHWLVTLDDYNDDKTVVFSNADHNSWNPIPDGEGYTGLLDEDSLTYWQSCWQNKPDEEQFLQFKLNKPVQQFAVYLNKRRNQGNQATQLDFYVSNDTTDVNGWVKAGSIKGLPGQTGLNEPILSYQSDPIYLLDAYQFVRVYWKSSYGHTHFAGFHFQNVEIQANSLNNREDIKGQVDILEEALTEASLVLQNEQSTLDEVSLIYDKLDAAYREYNQILPDATALKAYIEEVKEVYNTSVSEETYTDVTKIYPDPGTYNESDREQLKLAIEDVEESLNQFEKDFTYSQSDIDNLMQQLKDAFLSFKNKQRWIVAADSENAGVWYHIAASQRYFDITGKEQDYCYDSETGNVKYVRHGMLYIKPENGLMKDATLHVGTIEEMLANGVADLDYATWRFVNVGDTAYAIQNKATGLFVSKDGVYAELSLNPSLFKLDEIGYGSFILDGYNMRGEAWDPLHVQTLYQKVAYWENRDLNGGSCWDIYTTDRTEQGEPVGDYQFPVINYDRVPLGRIMTSSFPIGLQSVTDDYSEGLPVYEVTDAGKLGVVLSPRKTAMLQAGEPFFYLPSNDRSWLQSGLETVMRIQVASNPVLALPGKHNGLVGSYFPEEIPEKAYLLSERLPISFTQSISDNNVIDRFNSAYLIPEEIVSSGTSPESILIPFENISLESSDSLLLQLEKCSGYLDYLGNKAGQYLDTVYFEDTYTKALQKWSNVTEEQCREMLDSLILVQKALRLNLPKTSGAYQLKNIYNQCLVSNDDDLYLSFESNASEENSTFYYGNDLHLTNSAKHLQLNGAMFTADSLGVKYVFKEVMDVPGAVQIAPSDTTYLAAVGAWIGLESDSINTTYWYIEDVSDRYIPTFDIELRDYKGNGYTTLYLPVAVKLTDGMEAYVGKVEDGWLKMSKLEGDIVPPAVPVIIKGMPGNYQLPYDGYAENNASMQNDLRGVFVDKAVSEEMNAYTLQIVDNQLGFFKYSGSFLNAFKAYLDLPAGKQIRGMVWDDSEVTGIIDGLFDGIDDIEVYDLSGRRVKDMKRPGVYIVNGKKVVIK